MDLFERWPGSEVADHARGNRELQTELRDIFRTRTSAEWIAFSGDAETPIAPVNTPRTVTDDPQFQARFAIYDHEHHGADMLGQPLHFVDEQLPPPSKAPEVGQHTDEVLMGVLGYDAGRIGALRDAGALG
jgi:crotonobetainyl-CoA:carnitine CoA-transferase CaiB-like acyl-CoA transferase